MSKLITASLIQAIDWYEKCPQSWKERAHIDLKNQLSRIFPDPVPAPMAQGMAFEKAIYSKMNSDLTLLEASDEFKMVCQECKGGQVQKKIKKYYEVGNVDYCLYGKTDVFFNDYIIDIKTTGKFSRAKYVDSFQHKLYMFITKIPLFYYIIVEWQEYPKIQSVNKLELLANDDYFDSEIIATIKGMNHFFKHNPELRELYDNKFNQF